MKKLPITEASDEQLKTFAQTVLQIENVSNKRGEILAALQQGGWTQDHILVDGHEMDAGSDVLAQFEEPEEDFAPFAKVKGFGYWKDGPMVVLKIMSTDRPGGNEPAAPSVNGSAPLVIQRNQLVQIPYDFYLVLKNCVGTKVEPGEKVTDELVRTDYTDYPLSDVQLPSRAEIAAWQARTAGDELGHPKAKQAA